MFTPPIVTTTAASGAAALTDYPYTRDLKISAAGKSSTYSITALQHRSSELECAICKDMLNDPVSRFDCTHIFCRVCITHSSVKACATCACPSKKKEPESPVHITRQLEDMKYICPVYGCTIKATIPILKLHLENGCTPFLCFNEGCKFSGTRETAQSHNSTCPKAMIFCQRKGCDEQFKRKSKVKHEKVCRQRDVELTLPGALGKHKIPSWAKEAFTNASYDHSPFVETDSPYAIAFKVLRDAATSITSGENRSMEGAPTEKRSRIEPFPSRINLERLKQSHPELTTLHSIDALKKNHTSILLCQSVVNVPCAKATTSTFSSQSITFDVIKNAENALIIRANIIKCLCDGVACYANLKQYYIHAVLYTYYGNNFVGDDNHICHRLVEADYHSPYIMQTINQQVFKHALTKGGVVQRHQKEIGNNDIPCNLALILQWRTGRYVC